MGDYSRGANAMIQISAAQQNRERRSKPMTRILSWLMVIIAVVLAGVSDRAISAQQDKYTLQVPNGLKFSDFRGYEDWQVVAVSQTDNLLKVMVANPTMIDAYRAGVPLNGKPFPDGSKIAKIEWKPKKS